MIARILGVMSLLLAVASAGMPTTNIATTNIATTQSAANAIDVGVSGHWEGAIQLPALPMIVHVDLAEQAAGWTGTIDIPQQQVSHLTLDPVAVSGSAVRFTIRGVPGDPTFDGHLVDGKIAGKFQQGGLIVSFSLGRAPYSLPATTRPQETITDTAYRSEEVGYDNGAIHLAATLTLPPSDKPVAAVVLITGSGAQNRDEEIAGHKPFYVLADALTRAGIAVLRADDRGVDKSTGGTVDDATTDELAGDTAAGIAYLKTRPEIDRNRIGLIGHSEGADIAALLASRNSNTSRDVAFIVMLAGAGVPGDQIIERQSALLAKAAGESQASIDRQSAAMHDVLQDDEHDADPVAMRQRVKAMIIEQQGGLSVTTRPTDAWTDVATDMALQRMRSRWFRYFLTFDPRVTLRKVTVPVLVLNGEKDLQVDPGQNIPAITAALGEAGNHDVTVKRLPGLNHLFQAATSGSVSEYATIAETINPAAIAAIRDWVVEQAGKPVAQPAAQSTAK